MLLNSCSSSQVGWTLLALDHPIDCRSVLKSKRLQQTAFENATTGNSNTSRISICIGCSEWNKSGFCFVDAFKHLNGLGMIECSIGFHIEFLCHKERFFCCRQMLCRKRNWYVSSWYYRTSITLLLQTCFIPDEFLCSYLKSLNFRL